MERIEILRDVAQRIETIVRQYGRRDDIAITFERMTYDGIRKFTDFQRKHKGLIEGEEYFLVWETPSPKDEDPRGLLYAVCITADSYLTAANELMNLVSRKF